MGNGKSVKKNRTEQNRTEQNRTGHFKTLQNPGDPLPHLMPSYAGKKITKKTYVNWESQLEKIYYIWLDLWNFATVAIKTTITQLI